MRRRALLNTALGVLAGLPILRWKRAVASAGVTIPASEWDAVEFTFESSGKSYPGIAIRLPLSAASRDDLFVACKICPHQGCEFGYEKNFSAVGVIVGKELANPVLFCRCHMSVYDPAQAGKVVNGPAPRPPWSFEYAIVGSQLVIEHVEEGVGTFGS